MMDIALKNLHGDWNKARKDYLKELGLKLIVPYLQELVLIPT